MPKPTPPSEHLTLLVRSDDKVTLPNGMPMIEHVSDPGPSFAGLRKFFRPWRLLGKLLAVGLPCWIFSVISAIGGYFAGLLSNFFESFLSFAIVGSNTAVGLALLPLGILALWAGIVGIKDLTKLGRHRQRAKAYADAIRRTGEPDILTPNDLRSPGILEGLKTLGSLEKLLASVDREQESFSALIRDSLYESKRLVHRSVLDLIQTERRLADWKDRLGEASTYKAKLEARRDQLAGSYAEILDQCLHTTDWALAKGDDDPADLKQSVDALLVSCQRALVSLDRTGPEIDEQELLMYAARASEEKSVEDADETRERKND